MTHTAELYTTITTEEYRTIIARNDVRWERDSDGKTGCHIRTLERYGITDIKPRMVGTQHSCFYYCVIIINLQRVVNNGKRTIETYCNEKDYTALSRNFARAISEVLPCHTCLNKWSLQRIDYNIDLQLTPCEVEQYIILFQRGGKNHSWYIHEFADEKKSRQKSKHGNRKKTHPEGSVIYDNKQYSVNIYNKHLERLTAQSKRGIVNATELKASEGILRIEIQVKKNKLNTIKKNSKNDFVFDGKPLEYFARYEVATPVIMKALEYITGRADYTTLENAQKRITGRIKEKRTQTAMIDFLRLVTRAKSLWRAKELYKGDIKVETILKHLNRLNINPVTIPVSFRRDTMENIFDVVAVQLAEEQVYTASTDYLESPKDNREAKNGF